MKKAFKIFYYAVLAALVAVAVLVIFSAFPITGNYRLMVVRSGSMEPAIKTGSVVAVKPASSYKIGDVISFKGAGKEISITHRVAEIRVDAGVPSYVTKGDANNAVDTRVVRQNEIIGKELFAIPYIGYAVEAARTTYGFIALIAIPAGIIIFDQFWKIWKEVKRMRKKEPAEAAAPVVGKSEL